MNNPNLHTKGELTPAKLINLVTKHEIPCMFNPYEYTLTKQNSWKLQTGTGKGKNTPGVTFERGGSQILKLTLHFDTLMKKTASQPPEDVSKITDQLWDLMRVDSSTTHKSSRKGHPPEIAFEWGRLYFRAVITSMSQKFTLFSEKGIPLRCQVDLTLEQFVDVDDYNKDKNITSISAPPEKVVVREGDRTDHLVAPKDHLKFAEKNGIDNPANPTKGKILTK